MSDTTRKPLPPALKALQHVLNALPSEEGSEDETETVNVKDFTVSAFCGLRGRNLEAHRDTISDQVGAKVFYPKGEIQREMYRTKDGKVRTFVPKDGALFLIG